MRLKDQLLSSLGGGGGRAEGSRRMWAWIVLIDVRLSRWWARAFWRSISSVPHTRAKGGQYRTHEYVHLNFDGLPPKKKNENHENHVHAEQNRARRWEEPLPESAPTSHLPQLSTDTQNFVYSVGLLHELQQLLVGRLLRVQPGERKGWRG